MKRCFLLCGTDLFCSLYVSPLSLSLCVCVSFSLSLLAPLLLPLLTLPRGFSCASAASCPPPLLAVPCQACGGWGVQWTSSTPMSMRGVLAAALMVAVVTVAALMVAVGRGSDQRVRTDPPTLPRKRWRKGQRELLLLLLC